MSKKILVADDSLTIRKVVELTFLGADQEIATAASGEEAMNQLTDDVDLFILDVHMPDGSGYELCERVKADRPDLPVVLLVGTFEHFDEDAMKACGADRVLRKPFDSQELASLVEELTGGEVTSGEEPQSEAQPQEETGTEVAAETELEAEAAPAEEEVAVETTEAAAPESSVEEESSTAAAAESSVEEAEAVPAGSEIESTSFENETVAEPVSEAGAVEAESPAASVNGLSEEDVERVAHRVVELLSDEIVRRVAWEVVPELAEVVVKERLEELESELSDA